MSNTSKQPETNPPEKPKPTDEVRPDIVAAQKPMETRNDSDGKTKK